MTTMVSTFVRSARVVGSVPGADNPLLAQELNPATRPSATMECTSSEWREAHGVVFMMNASIKRAAARRARNAAPPNVTAPRRYRPSAAANPAPLKCPGGADRQRVRVAVRGADPLVLGAKRYAPVFGLHTDTVGESVIGLVLTEVIGRGRARRRGA